MGRKGFKSGRWILALVFVAALAGLGLAGGVGFFSPAPPPEHRESMFSYPDTPPTGKLPEGVRPLHYTLDLRIDPQSDYFLGTATIEVEVDLHTRFIWLHGRGLTVSRIQVRTVDGTAIGATWEQVNEGGVAKVTFSRMIEPGTLMLQIEYDAPYSTNADGLYKVMTSDGPMIFSQFQAIDARRAFPGFDEPRFKTPYDISIIAPDDVTVITNTPQVNRMPVDDGEILYLFDTTLPLQTGVVAFVVGDLEVVDGGVLPPNDVRKARIPVRAIVRKGRAADMKAMLEATPDLVASMEALFGQAYPYKKLDLVAVPDFAWAGMENAATIFYREDYIFVNDQTAAGSYFDVIDTHAHELAHQWFGNMVTPLWWDDTWLSESFASWVAGKMIARLDGTLGADDSVKRYAHAVMRLDARPAAPRVHQPVANNEDIMGSFSDIAYFKGGGVLEMIEAYVGEDEFREGIALFIKRHLGGGATVDDFVSAIAQGSGHPEAASAFRSFIMQPGLPMVETTINCAGPVKELTFTQSRYLAPGASASASAETGDDTSYEVPVCYRTDKGSGCHLLTQKQQSVPIGKSCPAWVMPNKGGSGYYLWSLDEASLTKLVRNMDKLTGMESEALAYNLGFWFRSNLISAEKALGLIEVLSKLNRDRTDVIVLETLAGFKPYLSSKEERKAFNGHVNNLFGKRARALGFNPAPDEAASRSILRDQLTLYLVADSGDEKTRQRLYEVLEAEGLLIREGFPAGDRVFNHKRGEAVLALGVLDVGKSFTDDLFEMLISGEAGVQDHKIVAALARSTNKAVGRRLMDDFFLTSQLRSEAVFKLAASLAANPEQSGGFWTWMGRSDNMEKFLARLPESFQYEVVRYGLSICDEVERDQFQSVVGSRLDDIAGGRAEYAATLEAISECLAVKQTMGPELAAAL